MSVFQVGYDLKEEIERKFDKWQEPPPVKQVKPLPAPLDGQRKKRGGRRWRLPDTHRVAVNRTDLGRSGAWQCLSTCSFIHGDGSKTHEWRLQVDVTSVAKSWTPPSPLNVRCTLQQCSSLFLTEGIERWRSVSGWQRSGNMPTEWPSQRSVHTMLLKHDFLWLTRCLSFSGSIICMLHRHLMLYMKTKSQTIHDQHRVLILWSRWRRHSRRASKYRHTDWKALHEVSLTSVPLVSCCNCCGWWATSSFTFQGFTAAEQILHRGPRAQVPCGILTSNVYSRSFMFPSSPKESSLKFLKNSGILCFFLQWAQTFSKPEAVRVQISFLMWPCRSKTTPIRRIWASVSVSWGRAAAGASGRLRSTRPPRPESPNPSRWTPRCCFFFQPNMNQQISFSLVSVRIVLSHATENVAEAEHDVWRKVHGQRPLLRNELQRGVHAPTGTKT